MIKENDFSEWEFEEKDEEEQDEDEKEQDEEEGSDDPDHSDKSGDGDDPNKKSQVMDDDAEVEVDGEKVKLSELKKGYMRQADYTKKTQELSQKEKQEIVEKSKEVIENKDEFPEADVKAAEYFLKIAKSKFGLITREEYDAEKNHEKLVNEFENKMDDAREKASEMKGMPNFEDVAVMKYMQDHNIHDPFVAYKDMNDAEYRNFIISSSKGSKGYKPAKGSGDKPEEKEKKFNVHTEEGHRAFLEAEIEKMQSK